MAHHVTLQLQQQQEVLLSDGAQGFRIRIIAKNAVSMPAEIFLYRQDTVDPLNNLVDSTFMGVCSSADISYFPANSPDLEISPPFFRKSEADLILPSKDDATTVWQGIVERVQVLIDQLNRQDILEDVTEVSIS